MEHPTIAMTNLNGYPQVEPAIHSECTFCGTEIHIGDEVVSYDDSLFCDTLCMGTDLFASGVATKVVAGE